MATCFFNWWQIICTNNKSSLRVHLSKQKESHKKTENHPTVIYDLPNEQHTKQWKTFKINWQQFWSRKFCLQAVCIFLFNVCSLKPSSFTENCFYVFKKKCSALFVRLQAGKFCRESLNDFQNITVYKSSELTFFTSSIKCVYTWLLETLQWGYQRNHFYNFLATWKKS